MNRFLSHLDGKWLDDERFQLDEPLIYRSELLDEMLIVPKGFITDFASVPRVPIVYMAFGDRAHHESVPHDFLYQTHKTSKLTADRIFLEAMKARSKPVWIRYGMFYGVVLGGGPSYASGPERYEQINASPNL